MVLPSTDREGVIEMRLLRTILGMLLLTAGLPALLAGGAFWAALQHRDASGAFTGTMQRLATSGYAVVVDDVDKLLRADAPFARVGDTRLRVTADTAQGPAFVGLAPRADAAAYLADLPRISVASIDLGTGALPVTGRLVPGTRAPEQLPGKAGFWLATGRGSVSWNPADLRDTPYSLIIMNPAAQPGVRLESTAAVQPGWLNQATWGLLTAGTLLVMLGMIILGWPARRREVVYVVEPSQVPSLMQAIGAPLPLSRTAGGRHAATHRPHTLADTQSRTRPPSLVWPPRPAANSAAAASATAATATAAPAIPMPSPPVVDPALVPAAFAPTVTAAGAAAASPSVGSPDAPTQPVAPAQPLTSPDTPAQPLTSPDAPTQPNAKPAPGEPLKLMPTRTPGLHPSAAPTPARPPATPGAASTPARPPATPGAAGTPATAATPARHRPAPDLPIFEASAVGAWVAETAAARAKETEARAAAAVAAHRAALAKAVAKHN
uniref:hypothetical protein n=1 Tax=Actinoplanes sp. RD1 TaxID=3064538 RepID=UPI0027429273